MVENETNENVKLIVGTCQNAHAKKKKSNVVLLIDAAQSIATR